MEKRNLAKNNLEITERDWARIVEEHQLSLVRLAVRFVGNAEDAKDLAQSAFARLWLNRDRLEGEREAFYYLRKILVNLCIDHLRKHSRYEPEAEFDEKKFSSELASPLQQLETQELQNELLCCIDELKPKQKATLILRDVEGYSVTETAAMLGCTPNNVLCNLHLARENVRRKIQSWFATV